MIIECPFCGKSVVVNGFGRPRLNIPVNKVCDALELHHSVTAAARELGCSRGYIYKVLKERNLKVESMSRRVKRLRNVDVGGIDIVHL
jgi:predicted transcriptional regulator